MCGIGGILDARANLAGTEVKLRAMREALNHRGPDASGLLLLRKCGGGVVSTRLAVLDLTEAGRQPMTTPDGRLAIVFNGEIYNFKTLRREMQADGVAFRSNSDTEVILRLYEREGAGCVCKLRGMFAFAIVDEEAGSCFLARDALGIKPLYYCVDEHRIIFASELRVLLSAGLENTRLDAVAVEGYFRTGSVPEPHTVVGGVRLLEAGSSVAWRSGDHRLTQWWDPDLASPEGVETSHRPVDLLRNALLDSLEMHFVSDVPVGVFLSGGIDSTALVALSQTIQSQDLRTFSISFDDPALDESDLSRRTAERFGTSHVEQRVGASDALQLREGFLARLDQPTIDGFNTFVVSKLARESGLKVVLSGVGGDELFGGYPSFRLIPRLVRMHQCLNRLPAIGSVAASLLRRRSDDGRSRRLAEFLCGEPTVAGAYQAMRGIYSTEEAAILCEYFTGEQAAGPPEAGWNRSSRPGIGEMRQEISRLEIENYMRNQLLRDSDVMSMAWGLELRVPFVDAKLIESIARIPPELRFRAGKQMLLEAVPEVPDWVAEGPKRGFSVPFDKWMAGNWHSKIEHQGTPEGVRADAWYQKWSLFVFRQWCSANRIPTACESST